jgi:hypothetical protein
MRYRKSWSYPGQGGRGDRTKALAVKPLHDTADVLRVPCATGGCGGSGVFGNDPLHNTNTDAKFVERWGATIITRSPAFAWVDLNAEH